MLLNLDEVEFGEALIAATKKVKGIKNMNFIRDQVEDTDNKTIRNHNS